MGHIMSAATMYRTIMLVTDSEWEVSGSTHRSPMLRIRWSDLERTGLVAAL